MLREKARLPPDCVVICEVENIDTQHTENEAFILQKATRLQLVWLISLARIQLRV